VDEHVSAAAGEENQGEYRQETYAGTRGRPHQVFYRFAIRMTLVVFEKTEPKAIKPSFSVMFTAGGCRARGATVLIGRS